MMQHEAITEDTPSNTEFVNTKIMKPSSKSETLEMLMELTGRLRSQLKTDMTVLENMWAKFTVTEAVRHKESVAVSWALVHTLRTAMTLSHDLYNLDSALAMFNKREVDADTTI